MTPLPHLIAKLDQRPPHLKAVRFKRNSVWVTWDWSEYHAHIQATFQLLKFKGLKRGDRLVLLAPNSVEWALCDLAAQCLGVVVTPIYPNSSEEDVDFILKQVEPTLVCAGNADLLQLFPKKWQEKAVVFSPSSGKEVKTAPLFWELLHQANISSSEESAPTFQEACFKIHESDLATIVFTSGTSGKPKGVCLTHHQIISELTDLSTAFPISSQDTTLSFLPYAHILGRVEMWLSVYAGFTLAFSESIEKLRKNLLEIKPTVLIAVPRIFEKIYAATLTQLNGLFIHSFIETAQDKNFLHSLAAAPFRLYLDFKLKEKLKAALGGRLKYAISGGAPLAKDVAAFFRKCDVLLLEGYGLTETTGAICVNTPQSHHFGTVGKPLADVEIKLAADNEILIRSAKVFDRFLDDAEESSKDAQGFYRTGDIGEWTPDGFLRITDRKKDLIKTSGGKYVAPQHIENLFKKHPLISQVLVHGDRKKFIVALITLDPKELKDWALSHKVPFSKVGDLVHAKQVREKVEEIVKAVNAELASYESIKKFQVLDHEFSIEAGELTPSLKVRRKFCEQKYQPDLERLYGM